MNLVMTKSSSYFLSSSQSQVSIEYANVDIIDTYIIYDLLRFLFKPTPPRAEGLFTETWQRGKSQK